MPCNFRRKSFLVSTVISLSLSACSSAPPAQRGAERPRTQVLILGTIHGAHLTQCEYPLGALGEAIRRYHPNSILVEIRPEALSLGHLEDGPVEMTYVTRLAQNEDIPVFGIDWWREEDFDRDSRSVRKLNPKEKARLESETRRLMDQIQFPPSLVHAHEPATNKSLAALKSLQESLGQNPGWRTRQNRINERVVEIIQSHASDRILIFIGLEHRPELNAILEENPHIQVLDPEKILPLKDLVLNEAAPISVLTEWKIGLARIGRETKEAKGAFHEALVKKAAIWKRALSESGRCESRDP